MLDDEEEILVSYFVGKGSTALEEIAFKLGLQLEYVHKIIKNLRKKGIVTQKIHGLALSKKGLLEFSRYVKIERCRIEQLYSSVNRLPYFSYKNGFGRDVIFHPNLFFDMVSSDDLSRQFVYEIIFRRFKGDIDSLEIVCNLLCDVEGIHHVTGFWILKCREKNVCGWGINNLKKSLHLVKPDRLIFLIGFQDFVFLFNSVVNDNKVKETKAKVYLTRDTYPYIDTLDLVGDRLGMFFRFLGIPDIPRGKEIELKIQPLSARTRDEYVPEFVPKILGKIGFKEVICGSKIFFPFIIVMDPANVQSSLNKVSPWFVTCAGGFMEEDFKMRTRFYLHYLNIVSLPDIDIVAIMLG